MASIGLLMATMHKHEYPMVPLPCPNGCEVGTVLCKDLNMHKEICTLEIIKCEYYDMGCKSKIARKDIKDHNRENVNEHLHVLKHELAGTKQNLACTSSKGCTECSEKSR